MNRPTVSQAVDWQPEALAEMADSWEAAASQLSTEIEYLTKELNQSRWVGAAAASAREKLVMIGGAALAVTRGLVAAAAAARDGAGAIGSARRRVLDLVAEARASGHTVADDGSVTGSASGNDMLGVIAGDAAQVLIDRQAAEFTDRLGSALDALGAADAETAADITAGFNGAEAVPPATRPTGLEPIGDATATANWPVMSQDRIAGQIAAMTPDQRRQLIVSMPRQVGNTDGVPWEMRIAANRINIADAILGQRRDLDRSESDKVRAVLAEQYGPAGAERMWPAVLADPGRRAATIATHDRDARRRIAFYQGLLAEVPDPTRRSERPVPRQILAFDPARASLVELNGDLRAATAVGVLVPGLNTTITDSATNTTAARRFVAAGRGNVAMITYLGGPFPTGQLAAGVLDAADPRYALDMAPRLVAFSEDVNRTVEQVSAVNGRGVPVTYIGHSYGGSIVGTAERLGLTADRVIYVEAAGAGVGVQESGDWHNRNPDVLRFSMTAPGDPIELVQGLPTGPHGADPDELPGVIRLDTGRRLNGEVMSGLAAHSDVLDEPSDAWRNVLGVMTGDRGLIRVSGAR
jgi:hypothetical protein